MKNRLNYTKLLRKIFRCCNAENRRQRSNFREAKVENFPYMIVYEFFKQKQMIHIAAIYHNKRNPKGKYRRLK
jgi:hypothetical protein